MGRTITITSRLLIGLLFVFSGFVKCIDPIGSAIKFEEYFTAFGMDWLIDSAIYLAVLLSSIELILGCTLIFGLYKRISAWIALLFLSTFTILTIIIYATNPVEDCGCFGDAIKLTNGETLLKNIISVIIFIPFFLSIKKLEWVNNDYDIFTKFIAIVAIVSFIPIYTISYLPFFDFLPYNVGVNIPLAMSVPHNAEQDVYETTLIYKNKKDGKTQEFAVDDTTWYDQTKWEYVDTNTKLIKEGYAPSIAAFNVFDKEKKDVTARILTDKKVIALFVINSKEFSDKILNNISNSIELSKKQGITPIFVTRFEIDWLSGVLYSIENNAVFDVYNADETLLKSLIRAKFGIVVLKDGTIKSKHNLNHSLIIKKQM